MKRFLVPIAAAAMLAAPAHAENRCAADAKLRAAALLKLHMDGTWEIDANNISADVKELPPVKALVGKGKFDVLEVEGQVYKATYRLRMIYAQIPDSCVLIGQEVIEIVDPY